MKRSYHRQIYSGIRDVSLSFLILIGLAASPPAVAAGTPGANAEEVPAGQTADDTATGHYRAGLEAKSRALGLETAAHAASDASEQARLSSEAQAAWQEAVTAFGRALKLRLDHYEAANELGYSLRRSGDYQKALGAYNFALTIKPDFYPAVEYRGEAYLALGRIEEAKAAYLTLFRAAPDLAAQLLEVMAERAVEADFSAWVSERQALAAVTPGAEAAGESSW
jgi:tetratricopeptide (TPR) repeat protein